MSNITTTYWESKDLSKSWQVGDTEYVTEIFLKVQIFDSVYILAGWGPNKRRQDGQHTDRLLMCIGSLPVMPDFPETLLKESKPVADPSRAVPRYGCGDTHTAVVIAQKSFVLEP